MTSGLEAVTRMEYPGRFIIVGRDRSGHHNVVVYGITGRSPSSQARKLVHDEAGKRIFVQPTDEKLFKTGNPDLLVYDALFYSQSVSVSNGKQTIDIQARYDMKAGPLEVLASALRSWKYEPEEPNFTPRISGCVRGETAALSIIKRDPSITSDHISGGVGSGIDAKEGFVVRQYFEQPLVPGMGKLISTYTGINANPLPSFVGEPLDVALRGISPFGIANNICDALAPNKDASDYRVAVACLFSRKDTCEGTVAIINRHDR